MKIRLLIIAGVILLNLSSCKSDSVSKFNLVLSDTYDGLEIDMTVSKRFYKAVEAGDTVVLRRDVQTGAISVVGTYSSNLEMRDFYFLTTVACKNITS
jgi:hypothetical protein